MAWPLILVRYGEIGIKSRSVRIQFEKRLVERIEEQLVARGVEAEVTREQGRIFVRAADVDRAMDALRHTFGIVSASPATECEATMEAVADAAVAQAKATFTPGATFALRVKRTGSQPFTSLDVAKHAAERIFDALPDHRLKVKLDEPQFAIHVEVREGGAFLFTRTDKGPGGLPLGSQGRVALLVDSPRAAHAAWLMAKRGSSIVFFAPDPAQGEAWLKPLQPWMPKVRILPLPAADRAAALAALAPLLAQHRCQAVVVADGSARALASAEEDKLAGAPVFRPLVGYEGARFHNLARQAELPEVA